MRKAWRRAAVAALGGAAAIAAQLTATIPAQAASTPSISIAVTAKAKPVTGYVMVFYRSGAYSTASVHGTITGGAAGEVAALYGQQFPFKRAAVRLGSIRLTSSAKVSYAFKVTPTLVTKYDVRLFASTGSKAQIAISPLRVIFVQPGGATTGGPTKCGRPVCHETFRLWWIVPDSVLGVAMKDPIYAYFGINLGTVKVPPPPYWLYKNGGGAKVSGPHRVNAGEFETTVTYTFTIGYHSYYWLWIACGRDQMAKDGLGLPGYHGCGASRVPRTVTYLG